MTWTVSIEDEGVLLREFLRESKQLSRKALADIKFQGGAIFVNSKEETVRYVLKSGDKIQLIFPREEVSEWIVPTPLSLDVVFEDEHLLIINKPPHLPTIPSRNHSELSLAGAVINYYNQCKYPATFHAINRLDRDTSGLLMIAKHRYIHDLFSKQQVRQVQRRYQALVHGRLELELGTINVPIARKPDSIIERVVSENGQFAVTHYKVLERFDDATLVQVSLETGRTHQIRVHFSHIGHPLLGDTLYGGKSEGIHRQALHSSEIQFFHPIDQHKISFTCPLAKDIEDKLTSMRMDI
ncbi:RluA family pseudouridine synthase [Evansella sp. AB-rgal1]|uniref:RluA family pseudouridine synthase n=1 Tax=Evansella sp. AB-rgal1 TaxID=3242696 RepID=UPI00359F0F26